jgi:SAM-dependent methyltransferase
VVLNVRRRVYSTIAGQLGHPSGLLGKGVALFLNQGNRSAIAAAVDVLSIDPGKTVADIGFGGGVGLPMLLKRVGESGTVYGVEISGEMLASAERRLSRNVGLGTLHLLRGSMTDLPLGDSALDAAITVNTVYFVPDLDLACAELARVLHPRGRLVVGIGDPEAMARMPFTSYGFTLRPPADVIAALKAAGLSLTEHRRLDKGPIPHHLLVVRR